MRGISASALSITNYSTAKPIRIYSQHSRSKVLIGLESYFQNHFSIILVQTRVVCFVRSLVWKFEG